MKQATKPGANLINVSRGALIDIKALIEGLKRGRLGGVGLDVYEEEGVFFEDLSGQILHDDELARLLTFPNVLITGYQAFLTREALPRKLRCDSIKPDRVCGGPTVSGRGLRRSEPGC